MKIVENKARDRAKVIERLPSRGWTESIDVPSDLKGAKVLFVGSFENFASLIIDYLPKGGKSKRVVLDFTECGMWIGHIGPRPESNRGDGPR